MSEMKAAGANEQLSTDNNVKEKVDGDAFDEGPVILDQTEENVILDQTEENVMPSSQEEEEAIKKKYGGMLLKKPPLISKDHERAYFDSADWALGKQQGGQPHKPKGPLEALRPKLQPTRQQQVRSRRSVYASSDNEDGGNAASEDVNNNNSTNTENSINP